MLLSGPLDVWYDTFVYFIQSDLCPKTEYPIALNRSLNEDELKKNDKYIIFNTEQLSREYLISTYVFLSKLPNVIEIWDYSFKNVEILKNHGVINVKHVPLQSPKIHLEKILHWKTNVENSVGFCGGVSPRRKKIFDDLILNNIKINIVQAWGDEKDKKLAKNKIILNVHYDDDYKIFEQARCIPWINAGYIVISEESLDNDSRCINVPYEKIVETIKNVLN